MHARLRIAVLQSNGGDDLVAALAAGLEGGPSGAAPESVKRWLQRHVPEYRPG